MRTHDKLPQAIKNNGTQRKIREWCKSNKLADHLVLIRTGKPVGAAVKAGTIDRKRIFEQMFKKKVSVQEAKKIAKSLKERTENEGMFDIVRALVKDYIKIK